MIMKNSEEKPAKTLKARFKTHFAELEKLDLQEQRIYKAYCKTEGKNLNSSYVTWDEMKATQQQHRAMNPSHNISYSEIIPSDLG